MSKKHYSNEKRLLIETLRGNISSFEPIVKKYQDAIFRHTLRILKDPDKASDATQETFIRVFKNLSKFKFDLRFKPWLYKIATNICYDIIKKDSKLTGLNIDIKSEAQTPLDKIIEEENKSRLKKSLKKLPNKYKNPLVKFYFDNLSYKSISKRLKLPINTVRTRIRRGKMILHKKMS